MLIILNKYLLTTCLNKDIQYTYKAILFNKFYDPYNNDTIFKWAVTVKDTKMEIFYISLLGKTQYKEWQSKILI